MAKSKEPKVARIRFVEPTHKMDIAENGCFVFEAWLPENDFQPKGWGHIMTCPCTKSVQYPDAPDIFCHENFLPPDGPQQTVHVPKCNKHSNGAKIKSCHDGNAL